MKEKAYWYWLCHIKILGAARIRRLLTVFGTPEAVFRARLPELLARSGLSEAEARAIEKAKEEWGRCEQEWAGLAEKGIHMITCQDSDFLERLEVIPNPPACLFVKGEIPQDSVPSVAIVGARAATGYGVGMAEELAGELSRAGCWIISGLAHGIDRYAHKGAVGAGGRTCGVLGCGVDICYPKENYLLYEEILAKSGSVLSEFLPGTPPLPMHFPIRNRLISGLADVVLVVEARKRSGSLITAAIALEQGKDVFALPGRISDPLSRGCLELIRDGAQVLMDVQDIFEILSLPFKQSLNKSENMKLPLAEEEKLVYSAIARLPKHLDEILREVELPGAKIFDILLSLELDGWIRQTEKNYYTRAR
ncbi:MAG: DNA-protecting protein DprA [Lachnospiraceae bacterium]|nr:DNA-protecting protein DprA [Lachnospiraceae bacterium]